MIFKYIFYKVFKFLIVSYIVCLIKMGSSKSKHQEELIINNNAASVTNGSVLESRRLSDFQLILIVLLLIIAFHVLVHQFKKYLAKTVSRQVVHNV